MSPKLSAMTPKGSPTDAEARARKGNAWAKVKGGPNRPWSRRPVVIRAAATPTSHGPRRNGAFLAGLGDTKSHSVDARRTAAKTPPGMATRRKANTERQPFTAAESLHASAKSKAVG
jgi:hypothetical protein